MNHSKTTLLLIDDDFVITQLLEKVMHRAFGDSLDIFTINDPHAAKLRIEQGGIDILITDLDMPEISGLEMLKTAKERNACTQAMMLTGHSTHMALLDAIEIGAMDYLVKPVDQEELIELVRQAMERSKRWKSALLATWKSRHKETTAKI